MDLALYREDPDKQKNGSPVYYGDATFWVRRYGTPESNKALKDITISLFGPLHKWNDTDESVVIGHWLAEYGIAKWESLEDDGEEVKYSKSKARKVFTDLEFHLSLNLLLLADSKNFNIYLYDAAEDDEKVLKKK